MSAKKKLALMTAAALVLGATLVGPVHAAETLKLSEVSHLHGIAVDPADPSRLYLATHHGVWVTNPDGTATRVSDNRSDYMGFTPNPAQPGAFFASGHPERGGNLGVLVSTDGAKTWKQISAGVNGPVDFHSMDVSPADSKVLYGHYGSIQVSRDGGKTWEVTGKPPADMFDLAASSKDPNTVYGATRAGLLVSRDAGKTWQAAYIVQRPATMVVTTKDGTAYAFQVGTGLLKTIEPSMAWQPVSNGFGDAVLLHLAVDPTNPERLYAVTDKSAILASQDGGKTWKPLQS
ncbi:exo-alpha-sialidase [Roseomonas genomospecies 6]|uniref:Exo-alpha-sialidase n=1 Tax=Roseomonas genomospecies 6 TaxID=214106 RepID=A0A9W7NIF5_9PROT|nr:exo-alpha-sialidase [Roseomonas genomospecies 6]KAA0679455.1 exo-alpha-sialidase [Roseomonas genomospecies 6]